MCGARWHDLQSLAPLAPYPPVVLRPARPAGAGHPAGWVPGLPDVDTDAEQG